MKFAPSEHVEVEVVLDSFHFFHGGHLAGLGPSSREWNANQAKTTFAVLD
jgi:hypothetical protein